MIQPDQAFAPAHLRADILPNRQCVKELICHDKEWCIGRDLSAVGMPFDEVGGQ